MRNSIVLFLITYFSFALQAQDKSFKVEVSSDSILVGNYIEVKFILVNIDGECKTPDFEGMKIVGGPNQSSSMSSINGDVRQQKSISYFVEPLDIGEYFISPAYVVNDDMNLETAPLKLTVVPNPDGIIQRPPSSQGFDFEFGDFGDFFDNSDFFGQDELFPERKKEDEKSTKSKVKKRKI